MTGTPVGAARRRRAGIGIGFLVLFLFALGVFLLPFAFPTEGAIVARFASTAQFSPNTPGGRATAGVAIQMRDPGRLTLTVMQGSQVIRTLIPTRSRAQGLDHHRVGRDQPAGRSRCRMASTRST